MKFLIGLFLSFTFLFSQSDKLIIDANNFETNDEKGLSVFTGNVKLKISKDKLSSDKLEIYVKPNSKGKSKKPLKYIATGNVKFTIFSEDKKYMGKGNKIIYNPSKKEYTILGNGYLKELGKNRELFGEKIFINQLTGDAKVSGSENKPVRFILNIESNDEKK